MSLDPSAETPETLSDLLARAVHRFPDRVAIIAGDVRLTYTELATCVDRMAAGLAGMGVARGHRVAHLGVPSPEVVITVFACSRLGAVYVGLGTRLAPGELEHVLLETAPTVVVALREFEGREYAHELQTASGVVTAGIHTVSVEETGRLSPDYMRMFAPEGVGPPPADAAPDSPLAIIFTSGTTGVPKGVVLTHRGLLAAAEAMIDALALTHEPRILSLLPVDHVGFLGSECVIPIGLGATIVQLPRFDPSEVLRAIEAERITAWIIAVPTMLQRLARSGRIHDHDLSSLEFVGWAGPLTSDALFVLRGKVGRTGTSYGMSEASGGVTLSHPEASDDDLLHSVGHSLPSMELRLRQDPSLPDDAGEIQIRGPQLFAGYWRAPELTEAAMDSEGWFSTGDLGRIRDDGSLELVGRRKELIRTGGYNVSPSEVEAALRLHGNVDDVVVVGVPDTEWGEAIHAVWTPTTPGARVDDEDLARHVASHLAGYKVPKRFWRREQLPLLANNKVDRQRVADGVSAAVSSEGAQRR